MKENLQAMVLSSLLGDSLAMPAHWVYDTVELQQRFGRIEDLLNPPERGYHKTKSAGQFTHYGDQTMILLESVAVSKGFSLGNFAEKWRGLFEDYDGYFDHATKATLKNFADGGGPTDSGSSSTDLAGAARIAPLVYCYAGNLGKLVETCRTQTAMTHNNPMVIDSAEILVRLVHRVLDGAAPVAALKELSQEISFSSAPFHKWIEEGLDSTDRSTIDVIAEFGQSCATQGAFPAVVHLVGKYQNDLPEGLVENVMAGGDSAARGLIVGMVLGAHNGGKDLPEKWLLNLKDRRRIMDSLERIGGERS